MAIKEIEMVLRIDEEQFSAQRDLLFDLAGSKGLTIEQIEALEGLISLTDAIEDELHP